MCDCTDTTFTGPTCGKEAATLSFNGSQHMEVTMGEEQITQAEEIVLRFKTTKPLGLLLITSTAETGDRIELAVAAGRIRLALRLGVKDKKPEDKEKDKVNGDWCMLERRCNAIIFYRYSWQDRM